MHVLTELTPFGTQVKSQSSIEKYFHTAIKSIFWQGWALRTANSVTSQFRPYCHATPLFHSNLLYYIDEENK